MKEKVYEFEYLSEVKLRGDGRTNYIASAIELKVGDAIVIEKEKRGIFLGRIIGIVDFADGCVSDYKYIGDAGETVAAYLDAIEKEKQRAELRKEMEAKFAELDREKKYAYYATLDEDFRVLYDKYKKI